MNSDEYEKRFAGIGRLYGLQAMRIISDLNVCVVGIGGVGSWVVEALARSGICRLTLIDYDEVCITNTNRQIHALEGNYGRKKIQALAERVEGINPDCMVHCIDDYLTLKNMADYLVNDFDYVVDAIDSIKFKAAMIHHCKRNKIPVITTGGAGGLTDPQQIQLADLSKTYNDPLAAKVRATLRRDYGFSKNPKRRFGVECIFSGQQQVYPKDDGTVSQQKPGIHGVSLDCRFGYGATALVTASFGFLAAARVIDKSLAKRQAKTSAAQ